MRVRQAVEDLGGDLDRLGVVELLRAERLAQRAAPHVLVRDVHVAGVAAEVVGPDAALVAQPGGGLHLARRARAARFPSRGTIFNATSRPVRSSRASQTDPEPPRPSGFSGR